jgi:hypothetical protein
MIRHAPFHWKRILSAKLFGNLFRPTFSYQSVVSPRSWACVDLGAFQRPLQDLAGLSGVVLMEDRDPDFFLSFTHYLPWADTLLVRHGPLSHFRTHLDLKGLVKELHEQGINVVLGFWNYTGRGLGHLSKALFFRQHPEFFRVSQSSDVYPFVTVQPEGVSYAEYIGHQYQKLAETFGFDGLMLGDGMSGFRSFMHPDLYRDKEDTVPLWTEFYATIARTVHRTGGTLFAYDCMGYAAAEARHHGIDYKEVAQAGLDVLVYQSYPQAWGEYWLSRFADRYDLSANLINIKTVRKALAGTKTKILYTVELGDSVEQWWGNPDRTAKQIELLDPLSDGRFLVWGNDLFAALPKHE